MPEKRRTRPKKSETRQNSSDGKTTKTEANVLMRIELNVMGVEARRRVQELIEQHLNESSGRVVDRQSYSRGCFGRGLTFDVRFSNRTEAISLAFVIYLQAEESREHADRCCIHFYIDGERLEMEDEERTTDGAVEMLIVLVNKYFDEYHERGGKLGRHAFLHDCLGSTGGVERIYVEEGLTPSWQERSEWYFE